MYCQYCAAPLGESALSCARCGRAVGAAPAAFPPQGYPQPYPPPYPYQQPYAQPYRYHPYPQPAGANTLAVLGFVFTLIPFVPFVGFVLCIAGYSQCRKTGQQGRGLALAGIVLGAVGLALAILCIAALVFFTSGSGLLRESFDEYAYIVLR